MTDNKWTRPEAPPAPLYLNKKEIDLTKQINDEIIERIIGEEIAYYPIDLEITNFHPIYGEAIKKNFLPPIRVFGLVRWSGLITQVEQFSDSVQTIEVGFQKRRITEDQDLYVRLGDYVLYGQTYYEIVKLDETRQLFGQIQHKFEINATCLRAREGTFDAN